MKASKKRCARRPVRLVRVDMGYETAEHWVTTKVVSERTCQALFGAGTTTSLLVEIPGGARMWIDHWKDIPGEGDTTN